MEENKASEEKIIENTIEVDDELAKLKRDYDDLDDRYKRILAEFENFKKRSSKERENLYNMITGDVLVEFLPVMDNLEKAANATTDDKNYQEGVVMVVNQYKQSLEKFGLKPIESVGCRFDPELHEAVGHVEDANKGEQEIVEEYRKGYQLGAKVIRHALVVVAN